MQLIDQVEVSDASSRQVLSGSNIQDDVDKFASFAEATSYTDDDIPPLVPRTILIISMKTVARYLVLLAVESRIVIRCTKLEMI